MGSRPIPPLSVLLNIQWNMVLSDNNPHWYRPRKYLHFDAPVSLESANRLVMDVKAVAQHSFFPFISYQIKLELLSRKSKTGQLERKTKPRNIAYASHIDSHIYRYYASILGKAYEAVINQSGIDKCVLAFRSIGKSNIDFAAEAFEKIRRYRNCYVVAMDIEKFFDNLDHAQLKSAWAKVINRESLPDDHYAVFKSLTNYSSVDKERLYDKLGISIYNSRKDRIRVCDVKDFRDKVRKGKLIERHMKPYGIPQGTPISALLSNIYMFEFDVAINNIANGLDGVYLRYCDDMLFIVESKSDMEKIVTLVMEYVCKLKLTINENKTVKREFHCSDQGQKSDKPLQYLGFTFDGQHILIRSAAFARYSAHMKAGVKIAKNTMHKRNVARMKRGESIKPLFKRYLFKRYSYLGKRNFVKYGHRAAKRLESDSIRRQLRPLWKRLLKEISD